MADIAAIYREATTPPRLEVDTKKKHEESQMLSHQHQVSHKNWLDAGYTTFFLDIIKKEIAREEKDLREMSLAPLEPSRYFLLKDKLQKKTLLEQVLKCAQEGLDKLQ